MNQLRKCRLNESEESPQNICKESIDAIFDHFDLDTPQVSPQVRRSGRKRKCTQPRKSQEEKILIALLFFLERKKLLEEGWNFPASWTLRALYYKGSNILIREHTVAVAAVVQEYYRYDYQYWTLSFVTFVNESFLPLNRVPCFPSVYRLWVHISITATTLWFARFVVTLALLV